MPMRIVVVLLGQLPHAPLSFRRTTRPSISTSSTSPPSAIRYGRTSSRTSSTLSAVSSSFSETELSPEARGTTEGARGGDRRGADAPRGDDTDDAALRDDAAGADVAEGEREHARAAVIVERRVRPGKGTGGTAERAPRRRGVLRGCGEATGEPGLGGEDSSSESRRRRASDDARRAAREERCVRARARPRPQAIVLPRGRAACELRGSADGAS